MGRKMVDKHKFLMRLAARYLVVTKKELLAAEVYQNMTFKNGKLVRNSNQSCSLSTLQMKMSKHPVFVKSGTRVNRYTCSLESYKEYFDDDPYYDWTKSNWFDATSSFGGRI